MEIDISDKIKQLEKKLNDSNIVECKWYRRNHMAYEIVCYTNNIIALHHSENYESIPVFINRAKKFLLRKDPNILNTEYIELLIKYLALMEIKVLEHQKAQDL